MGSPEKRRRDASNSSRTSKRKLHKTILASKALRTNSLISNNSKKGKIRRHRPIILKSKNPFINFFRDYKKKHPHMSIVDLASKVAKLWNVMSNKQREKFSLIKGSANRNKSRKATDGMKKRRRSKSKQEKKNKEHKKKEEEEEDDDDEEDEEERSVTVDSASDKEEEYVSSGDE